MNHKLILIRKHQHGAVTILAAAFMLTAILCIVLVVDTGRLYVEKNKLQRTADLAAVETSSRYGNCATGTASTYATQSATRNNFTIDSNHTLQVTCGVLTVVNGLRTVVPASAGQANNAFQIVLTNNTPASLIAGGYIGNRINLTATAIATRDSALAALTIRTTLLSVDSSKSALLNTLFTGFLGSNVSLSLVGWQGLISTQINLFSFLDQLKVNLGLTAGGYDQVLATNVTAGQVLDAASTVLTAAGSASSDTLVAVSTLRVAAMTAPINVQLVNLLGVQTGMPSSGAAFTMSLFDLVQGAVELSNSSSALTATLPITIPGIATSTITMKVIQPPIMSAIGNPELAQASPLGQNRIYVRSAQVRTLISFDLSFIPMVSHILHAVTSIATPITNLLNTVFSENIISNLFCALIGTCTGSEIAIVIVPNARLDMNIDAGSGSAYVNSYNCVAGSDKTLTSPVTTALATIRIGQLGTTAANAVANTFSSASPPTVNTLALAQFGYYTTRQTCLSLILCNPKQYLQSDGSWSTNQATAAMTVQLGMGINTDSSVLGPSSQTLTFTNPPEITSALQSGDYQSVSNTSLTNSMSNTLANTSIGIYRSTASGTLTTLLTGYVTPGLNGLSTAMGNAIQPLLSAALTPLINLLFDDLGLNLAQTDVAGQLSCSSASGVSLVY